MKDTLNSNLSFLYGFVNLVMSAQRQRDHTFLMKYIKVKIERCKVSEKETEKINLEINLNVHYDRI